MTVITMSRKELRRLRVRTSAADAGQLIIQCLAQEVVGHEGSASKFLTKYGFPERAGLSSCQATKEAQMTKNNRTTRWSRVIGGTILLAASVAMVTGASANEAVEAQAATGPASVVDLQAAPELANPPHRTINPDRTLHNNISVADHLAAKKKAATDLVIPLQHRPKSR
jgi:hypothetical protein